MCLLTVQRIYPQQRWIKCLAQCHADPGYFVKGGGGYRKSFDNAFFSLFLVSNLFDRGGPMVYFKEYYNFSRFQWAGVQHLPEGSNFFPGRGPIAYSYGSL